MPRFPSGEEYDLTDDVGDLILKAKRRKKMKNILSKIFGWAAVVVILLGIYMTFK